MGLMVRWPYQKGGGEDMQLEKIQHTLPKIPELVMQTLITAIDQIGRAHV